MYHVSEREEILQIKIQRFLAAAFQKHRAQRRFFSRPPKRPNATSKATKAVAQQSAGASARPFSQTVDQDECNNPPCERSTSRNVVDNPKLQRFHGRKLDLSFVDGTMPFTSKENTAERRENPAPLLKLRLFRGRQSRS